MPRLGFEPTIAVFERAKTVHASDRAATVVGFSAVYLFTYLLTELSPSRGAINLAATRELPNISWNPRVQYRIHKNPPLVPILSPINPSHTILSILILSTHIRLVFLDLGTSWR
jgi:hypothetical protein